MESMSNAQSTVYIVRLGAYLKDKLSPLRTEEPARDLAFPSARDAESYVNELVDRAKLDEDYETKCESDEPHAINGVVWGMWRCYLEFRDGRRRVLAEIECFPWGC